MRPQKCSQVSHGNSTVNARSPFLWHFVRLHSLQLLFRIPLWVLRCVSINASSPISYWFTSVYVGSQSTFELKRLCYLFCGRKRRPNRSLNLHVLFSAPKIPVTEKQEFLCTLIVYNNLVYSLSPGLVALGVYGSAGAVDRPTLVASKVQHQRDVFFAHLKLWRIRRETSRVSAATGGH